MKQYVSDCGEEGMLYGAVVRSPIARGRITGVCLPEGECTLIDANSIPGKNWMRVNGSDIPVFCTGEPSYKGEAVALVLAKSEEEARDGAKRANVLAAKPSSIPLQRGGTGVFAVKRIGKGAFQKGYGEKVFADADAVAESEHTASIPNDYLKCQEPSGALCIPSEDGLSVLCPTSSTPRLRSALCRVLADDGNGITVQVTARHDEAVPYQTDITAVQCAAAAVASSKSVSLMLSASEDREYNQSSVSLKIKYKAAVKGGRITALKIAIEADCGAYNPFAYEVLERVSQKCYGAVGAWKPYPKEDESTLPERLKKHSLCVEMMPLYEVPNVLIEASAVYSDRPPTGFDEAALDAMAMQCVSCFVRAISSEAHVFMLCGMELKQGGAGLAKAAAEIIKAAGSTSDYSRKLASANGSNEHLRRSVGMSVCGGEGGVQAAVVEMERLMFAEEIANIWLFFEQDKDESGGLEDAARLAAEKDALRITGKSINSLISITFVETKRTQKTPLTAAAIENAVHCLIPSAIDDARRCALSVTEAAI